MAGLQGSRRPVVLAYLVSLGMWKSGLSSDQPTGALNLTLRLEV